MNEWPGPRRTLITALIHACPGMVFIKWSSPCPPAPPPPLISHDETLYLRWRLCFLLSCKWAESGPRPRAGRHSGTTECPLVLTDVKILWWTKRGPTLLALTTDVGAFCWGRRTFGWLYEETVASCLIFIFHNHLFCHFLDMDQCHFLKVFIFRYLSLPTTDTSTLFMFHHVIFKHIMGFRLIEIIRNKERNTFQ